MPEVSVRSSPNGLPNASTFWPTMTLEESPNASGNSFSSGTWIWSTATSVDASAPMILAWCVAPSKSVTRTAYRLAGRREIGDDMSLLVDHEPRSGAGRSLVAEKAGGLGLGRDVDRALVGRVIDPDVVALVGIEILEDIFGWGRGLRAGLTVPERREEPPVPLEEPEPVARTGNLRQGGHSACAERSPKNNATAASVKRTASA